MTAVCGSSPRGVAPSRRISNPRFRTAMLSAVRGRISLGLVVIIGVTKAFDRPSKFMEMTSERKEKEVEIVMIQMICYGLF